jgi:protein Tex
MPRKSYDQTIAQLLNIRPDQARATIALLDDGNTVPFIARYRKEATFNLDEFLIRQVAETVEKLRVLDDRRDTILNSIQEQGKLSPELQSQIERADSLTLLEDLYAPYKPKRKTRASIARERGLQPLADMLLAQPAKPTPTQEAQKYLTADVPTLDDALTGARDIVAESISEHADVRGRLRDKARDWGVLTSKRIKDSTDEKAVYETYYEFSLMVKNLKPHQVLAINRGENEKVLRVAIDIAERDWLDIITSYFRPQRSSPWAEQLQLAIRDGADRLLLPAIERDIRRQLSDFAEAHAIDVFASNLRGLLNQPPLADRVVMGVDPAYRTGCKIAVVDASGKVLHTSTIYPHEPQRQYKDSLLKLNELITRYRISLIAIGNGTASRETEALIAELTRALKDVHYVIVNEAGASVYSASDLARAELPDLDVSIRGAVSIARRLQDPLAELVKIDPKSIGVGLYQHDVNQKELGQALDAVVESVVNHVGVDVNTASSALLQYVAGIGQKLAHNIVAYRDQNGGFDTRTSIKKVSGMGAKAFEQSAGFLRIRDGKNPLDASAIHPESYEIAKELLQRANIKPKVSPPERESALRELMRQTPIKQLAQALGAGELTLADILEQLVRPGRDPREDLPMPLLRSDVLSMDDLKEGMVLNGTVRNVVDFGAFVDIGVKQDGLLHISKIPRGTVLQVGDILRVTIVSVDKQKGRIGLGWGE